MLKSVAKKMIRLVQDRALPIPTSNETAALSELQATFLKLPVLETTSVVPSEATWFGNMNRLRELVLNSDPREFLRWDVIQKTMFVAYSDYLYKELKYLKHLADWKTRWHDAIKESSAGHPTPFVFYPASSGNLIHHAYHVAQFEEKTEIHVDKMDCILEFGGGYGSMCRLFHTLGFKGKYVIFDLPSFSGLQKYYLKTLGIPVQSGVDFMNCKSGVVCVSDIQQLKVLLKDHFTKRNTMFVGTWSISESPVSVRDSVIPLISEFQAFLIAYQDRFAEVDNTVYFDNWKRSVQNVTWHNWRIQHIPNSDYLIGNVTSAL